MNKVKNYLKRVAVGLSVVGLLASTDVMAASGLVSKAFSKVYVDSNTFTTIAKITKQQSYGFAYVTIDGIYKADGSSSNYQKIQGKVHYKSGDDWKICGSQTTIVKGTQAVFTIPKAGSAAGTTLRFRAMGNDPSLDCKISGHFDTY